MQELFWSASHQSSERNFRVHEKNLLLTYKNTKSMTYLELDAWMPPEEMRPSMCDNANIDARGADFRTSQLQGKDLSNALLCRADIRGADLTGVSLENADLKMACYDSETVWPEGFNFVGSGAIGPKASLSGSFLNNADLRGMNLDGASLMGAYLSGADLSGASLLNARLVGADLRYAVLRGARCNNARLSGCQLNYADLRGCNLSEVDFSNIDSIAGADFSFSTIALVEVRKLLGRPYMELDCWNPLTRQTTRQSLEGLL